MGTGHFKITLSLLLLLALTGCDKFEMRGFFISYESADERFEQSMEWNDSNPYRQITMPTDDYTIFAFGDSHLGGTKNLNLFLDAAISANAAAAVMVGDITSGHASDIQTLAATIPPQSTLTSFQIVGNHDLYFDGWKEFAKLFGTTTFLFSVSTPSAEDLYICLDTGSGTLGSKQLSWLKKTLANERENYRNCIIFTHNNLFRIRHTASTNPFAEELRVLLELSVKHSITMIIGAHDHKKNEVVFGHTIHITMDALLDGFKDAGYSVISLDQGILTHKFVNL